MTKEKLKPCPFCGNKHFGGKFDHFKQNRTGALRLKTGQIVCLECDAGGGIPIPTTEDKIYQQAISAWNRRV